MKLPKQAKPIMRNAMHSEQTNSGITPSGGPLSKCDCADGKCCAGACVYVPFEGYTCQGGAGCVPNITGQLC